MTGGEGMERISEMLVGASKDFDLAKRYKQAGEFTIAALLYTEATEKILKALFVRENRKEPPIDASIEYLALKTRMPKELLEDTALQYADSADEQMKAGTGKGTEERALDMESAVKRLLDYSMAYVLA
jgi:HEPN domain-containing protein